MEENDRKRCLEPNVEKPIHRRKTFFEVAAAQSSTQGTNPHLPDVLLAPTISVLDPCNLNTAVHARIKWSLVEARLIRNRLACKQRGRAPARSQKMPKMKKTPGVVRSQSDNPRNPLVHVKNGKKFKRPKGFPVKNVPDRALPARELHGQNPPIKNVPGRSTNAQKVPLKNIPTKSHPPKTVPVKSVRAPPQLSEKEMQDKREDNFFMSEVVELVRSIKKYSDPACSSSQTWIRKASIPKFSKELVMTMSYLPETLKIEAVVASLLFENGPEILENFIVNMPEHMVTIVNTLLNMTTSGIQTKYRDLAIEKIVQIYPCFLNRAIEKFSKTRTDCVFASRLALCHLGDHQFLAFLEPLLTDRESIFSKTVLRSSGREVLDQITARLLRMAKNVLDWHATPTCSVCPDMGVAPWCTRLSFCLVDLLNSSLEEWKEPDIILLSRFVFRTTSSPNLPTKEAPATAEEPMDLTIREDFADSLDSVVPDSEPETQAVRRPAMKNGEKVEPSPFGDAHETFVLSALIAVPLFTQYPLNQTVAVQPPDRAIDTWLDISRKRVLSGDKVRTSFGVHLIYVHSCITSSQLDELADFASEGMRRRVELSQQQNHAHILKNAFTTKCMSEIEVAQRSACQLVTKYAGNQKDGGTSLALRSIHALQTAGVYKTFQIDIGTWLTEQLEHISLPASEMLAEVVDGFAQSSAEFPDKGLKKHFVENAFSGDIFDGRTIAKRLFVLLYLCSYREAAHRIDSSLRNMHYDIALFRRIPARYLLSIMEQQHANFENVRSKIITRTAVIYPYMLPTPESMNLIEKYQKNAEKEVVDEEQFGSEREKRISSIRELKDMLKMLEAIDRSTLRNQLSAIPILLEIYMESLNASTPLGYEALLITIFNRLEQLDPRTLFETAVGAWLEEDGHISVEDIEKIPSLLFRCDRRILSSPPHFHCFVRALNFFNKMVRAENRLKMLMAQEKTSQAQVHNRLGVEAERKEKELLNGAYLDNQHSVLIHALIEVCDSKRMKDDPSDFAMSERRRQIRRIAFEYIHRTFLDYEGLIRIVLYQKFPLHQVRDMVEGVPALFAGNTQILEMLSLADQQRRFFAIVFAAEICRKYRVRESLEAARTVCDIVHSLHKFGELPSSNKLWKHVAPALMLLAREFPSLADSINRLLTRVSATAKNRLAVRCGLLAGDPRHNEYQLIETISEFLDRNTIHDRL